MPKKSIPQLKDKFQKGDKPMQEDFYDLLDSFIHRDEDISKILIKIASISEAENGSDNVKHMTPLLTKKAIYALTRLADIPDLATEVQQKIDASINSLLTLEDADNVINTVKDLLDFVQGAGEDLNIITELNNKETKFLNGKTITINGSSDLFYPVVFPYGRSAGVSNILEITKHVHSPNLNDGHFYAKIEGAYHGWGSHVLIQKTWENVFSGRPFLGKVLNTDKSKSYLVVWLRGGGRKYYFTSKDMFYSTIPAVYYTRTLISDYTSEENKIYVEPISSVDSNTATPNKYASTSALNDVDSKADNAYLNAIKDIRDNVGSAYDTLRKLYDWALGLFNTKIDKSVMSSNISSTSITNVATSKAVNDAKHNAISTAASDASGKADSARQNAVTDIKSLLVNDLITGGSGNFLSGEMGKELNEGKEPKLLNGKVIKIDGDANLFYPVVFPYGRGGGGSNILEIAKHVHSPNINDGLFYAKVEGAYHGWGSFYLTRKVWENKYSGNGPFLGKTLNTYKALSLFVVWLKGGGREYRFFSKDMPSSTVPSVYYTRTLISDYSDEANRIYVEPISSVDANTTTPDKFANTNGNSGEDFNAKNITVEDLIIK